MRPQSSSSVELQALLDATVDAVVLIDSRGCIEVFNRAAERLFGYSEGEVLGQNVKMLMTEGDREQHDAYLERYRRTGVPHIIGIGREVIGRRKDGTVFPAFLSVGRIAGAEPRRYVGFLQDLTLRHQALAAVVRERDRANRYLEAAQTVLVALDVGGRVMLINRKGCEMLALEETELVGSDWFGSRVPATEAEAARTQFLDFIAHAPRRPHYTEYQVSTGDGRTRLIAWRCVTVEEDGGAVSSVLCSGDDVTDIHRAEAEAREARERMMHVSRLATMGEMATGISHELNQPLAAITSFAQAARRLLTLPQPDLPEVTQVLDEIAGQALRAGEIIRRLRSLVRNRETRREPSNVNALIEELGTLTRADARMNDVRVTLDLAPGMPLADLDPIQIQQVLLNLLRNAIEALAGAPGNRDITISTRLVKENIEVRVRDSGPGVPARILDHLFQPFATTKPDGTGLGLAISRSIIEAHKGTLEYVAGSQGACFVFRLPTQPGSWQ
jgi:two-component system sensor kinase FixL